MFLQTKNRDYLRRFVLQQIFERGQCVQLQGSEVQEIIGISLQIRSLSAWLIYSPSRAYTNLFATGKLQWYLRRTNQADSIFSFLLSCLHASQMMASPCMERGEMSLMFSLLHVHFESVLRAIAETRPSLLKKVYRTFGSTHFHAASPSQRLLLLEAQIQQLAQLNDLFTEQVFQRIVHVFLKELELSNIGHVDLRIGVSTKKWRWMETIADGIQIFERELHRHPTLSLSFLGALNFAKPFAEIDEIFEILLGDQYVQKKFVGIDINIVPADLPKLVRYAPLLLTAQQRGMKINIHLGELFDNSFSKEVLSYLVPHRIGHGVRLLEDESLVHFLKRHDICLDMCPVSNTRLGVYDWKQSSNPVKKAMQLGIPVTINTDDPVLFQTTLSQEIELAHLNAEEIKMIQTTGRTYGYLQR